MTIHNSNRFRPCPGLVVVVLVAELLLMARQTTVIAFNAPSSMGVIFDTNLAAATRSRSAKFPLYTSLTMPSESRSSEFDENSEGGMSNMKIMKQKSPPKHDITIEKFETNHHDQDDADDDDELEKSVSTAPSTESSDTETLKAHRTRRGKEDSFYSYLNSMTKRIRNPKVLANRLDDELKRMESRYFQLVGDDVPDLRYPLGIETRVYNRQPVRPSLQVYELVAWAYGKSLLRVEGAVLAEDVLHRFQKHNPDSKPSLKLLGSIMRAWAGARNLEETKYWLQQIEEQYPSSKNNDGDRIMLPGYETYHYLVIGLTNMKKKKTKEVADLTVRAIETMRANHEATTTPWFGYLPSNSTYMAAIDIVKHSPYTSVEKFNLAERLLRYQLDDYKHYGRKASKPKTELAKSVFLAAGRCHFPQDYAVIERCEELLEDFHQLYRETGDVDFRPVPRMYERMMAMYARMNRRKNPRSFANRTVSILRNMNEMGVEFEKSFTAKAAINRVIQTAGDCIPRNPAKNAIKTRDMFEVCVEGFRLFHEGGNDNGPLAEPNDSSYHVFLRACSRLPEGETRSKLSAKAFHLCKENGLVSMGVCKNFYAANPVLAHEVFGVSMEEFIEGTTEIPEDWRKNVKPHRADELEILEVGFHTRGEEENSSE
jgi:hypothetical protein